MNFKVIFFFFLTAMLVWSCKDDDKSLLDDELTEAIERVSNTSSTDYFILPDETDYDALPNQDPHNPITEAKVYLGKFLFYETGLAQKPYKEDCRETYSCGSCHVPNKGFLPGRQQGIADGGIGYGTDGDGRSMHNEYTQADLDAQGTRPMTPLNSAYITNTLWSGLFGADGVNEGTEENWVGLAAVNHTGYTGLEAQNIEAFELHRLDITEHVLDDYGYRALYDEAFPDFEVSERYSPVTSSFAISAFLRTILANQAPFQKWLKGDNDAITENQKEGAILFFGKANCTFCHKTSALSSMEFHALGTRDMWEFGGLNTGPDDPRNLGRGMFTGRAEDNYRFKTPQLYNVKDYSALFHGSSKASVTDVVEFKDKAVSENAKVDNSILSPLFRSLNLTANEKAQLVDFLENALHDSNLERYKPDYILSGNCFPNNDTQSKEDLGCD